MTPHKTPILLHVISCCGVGRKRKYIKPRTLHELKQQIRDTFVAVTRGFLRKSFESLALLGCRNVCQNAGDHCEI
jgi:hypothetical protein